MSKGEWILAGCVAALFDLLGFLGSFIYLNFIVTIFAWMTFALWFFMKGVPFLGRSAVTSLIEFMPVIGALPGWTAMVLYSGVRDTAKKSTGLIEGGLKNMSPTQNKKRGVVPETRPVPVVGNEIAA